MNFYRFPGALLVAIAHYSLYFPISPAFRQSLFDRGDPLMGFFFTLSGFVMMHVYDGRIKTFVGYVDYLRRRFARIYPLFLATFLVFFAYGVYSNDQTGMYASNAILPNLLLIHAWNTTHMLTFNYPSWSVSAEMFVYLLFPAFLFMINRLGAFALALPFAFGAAVIAAFSLFGLGGWWNATFNGGCLRAAPSFVAGMVIYRLATRELASFRLPAWFAHAMANASFVLVLAGVPGSLMLIYMSALVFIMVAAEPENAGVLSRPLARMLANASYSFYLLHVLVGTLILRTLVHHLGLPAMTTYALAPVAMLVTTLLSIASFRFFENPLRRYLASPIRRGAAPLNFSNGVNQTVGDAQ
jgi:peptidoglycan/LPS O-acetylase OafA/YrhL